MSMSICVCVLTLILPKCKLHEEPAALCAIEGNIRPIALVQTGMERITLQLKRKLGMAAAIAVERRAASIHFGSSRPVKILGVDGAMVAYSLRADLGTTGVLPHFAAARPALGHTVRRQMLSALGVRWRMPATMQVLFDDDMVAYVEFHWGLAAVVLVKSGVR